MIEPMRLMSMARFSIVQVELERFDQTVLEDRQRRRVSAISVVSVLLIDSLLRSLTSSASDGVLIGVGLAFRWTRIFLVLRRGSSQLAEQLELCKHTIVDAVLGVIF
jgi:hypothetical protein